MSSKPYCEKHDRPYVAMGNEWVCVQCRCYGAKSPAQGPSAEDLERARETVDQLLDKAREYKKEYGWLLKTETAAKIIAAEFSRVRTEAQHQLTTAEGLNALEAYSRAAQERDKLIAELPRIREQAREDERDIWLSGMHHAVTLFCPPGIKAEEITPGKLAEIVREQAARSVYEEVLQAAADNGDDGLVAWCNERIRALKEK